MTTLIEFLEARLTEDMEIASRAAKSANGNHRQWYVTNVERRSETTGLPRKQKAVVQGPRRDLVADCPHDITPEKSTHIARHDPARVLREVQAKRAMADDHGDQHECTSGSAWAFPYIGCDVLRHLAAIYSDHPDYRKEWAA